MAVVVQRMVESDVSGVLFTCDPVQNRRDRMVVEAVLGLGEAVVSGQVTPDRYVLKRDGSVRRAQMHPQPYAIVAAPEGGTIERALSSEECSGRNVDDAQPPHSPASATTSSAARAGRRTSSGRCRTARCSCSRRGR
jgi:pyruvate,water dikinase